MERGETIVSRMIVVIPLNEDLNARLQENYQAVVTWWDGNKLRITDTRDSLIEDFIAQRID